MNTPIKTVLPVQGSVKNYHWGKVGNDSYIARFQATVPSQPSSPTNGGPIHHTMKTTDDNINKPLAELWFGSHSSGPASIIVEKQHIKLDKFLSNEPDMIGSIEHYHKFNKKLPFLFKILSVAQPLSLQAHPDKKLAQVLHQKDPKNYPDSNHKPELAIALTEFEVLCDFRPPKEILHFMEVLAPFRRIVGEKNFEQYSKLVCNDDSRERQRSALAECFKSLMITDKETIIRETRNLLLNSDASNLIDRELYRLVGELDKLYPGDPGIFATFFLNYLKLTPGQAIYLKANKLHAYIKGECIECMACSDNVVRAGLTTKYRDVDTLINMLDYMSVQNKQDILLEGVRHNNDPSVVSFAPTDEFKVDKIVITEKNVSNREYTLSALSSGSFILVFSGRATARNFFDFGLEHKLALGSAGFVPPKIALKLYNIQNPLTIYRSYC